MELYRNSDQKNKNFVELNFDQTPLVAALAVLSQIETEVAEVESKALGILAEKVGAEEFRVDQIEAMVSPESRVVTAGTSYRARLFVAASSSSSRPIMTSSESDVIVDESGIGNLEFVALANDFDERGRAKKVWIGTITLRTPSGDSTFTVREEYEVARPSLQFRSKAIQALYYNCGNNIQVSVPELGNQFNPSITAKGGEVIEGTGGDITVIPTQREVIISVRNNGIFIGTEKFRVKPIPKPTLEIYNDRGPLDIRKGGDKPRILRIRAIPDQDFAEFLPLDARYKVTKGEVILVRNGIARQTLKFDDDQVDLSPMASLLIKGDRLIIDIKEVKRKNYRGNVENVSIGVQVFSYEITK
jgi:gliding motility-associated protein GldM